VYSWNVQNVNGSLGSTTVELYQPQRVVLPEPYVAAAEPAWSNIGVPKVVVPPIVWPGTA
jgi:hypothetical protein